MKVLKDKIKVNIFCIDGTFVKGTIHLTEGVRLSDSINRQEENFIVVTEAKFQNIKEIHSFQLLIGLNKSKTAVIINKAAIKWIEEA